MSFTLPAAREAFCQHFAVHRSGPAAYRVAYPTCETWKPQSIATEASKLLRLPEILQRIREIQREATAATRAVIDLAALQQMLIDVIMVDPNELSTLKVVNCEYCWGDGHLKQWREREYVASLELATRNGAPLPDVAGGFGFCEWEEPHPDCPECRGNGFPRTVFKDTRYLSPGALVLYRGVKQTRNGLEMIFADRDKFVELLGRIIGAFNDKVTVTGQLGIAAALAVMDGADQHAASEAYAAFLQAGRESA